MASIQMSAVSMKPVARFYNPDPGYLRGLLEKAGLNRTEAARRIGISRVGLNNYLCDTSEPRYRAADYRTQFALECLAESHATTSPQGGNHGAASEN